MSLAGATRALGSSLIDRSFPQTLLFSRFSYRVASRQQRARDARGVRQMCMGDVRFALAQQETATAADVRAQAGAPASCGTRLNTIAQLPGDQRGPVVNVCAEDLARGLGVPRERRVEQCLFLLAAGARRACLENDEPAVAVELTDQQPVEMQQPRRGAGGDQGRMKVAVPAFPFEGRVVEL